MFGINDDNDPGVANESNDVSNKESGGGARAETDGRGGGYRATYR